MEREHKQDWVDRLTKLAGRLGLNEVRARWKLERWREGWRRRARRGEQRLAHVRYEHKTCPTCGQVADRAATVCHRCGAKLRTRWMQVLGRLGLAAPRIQSTSLVVGALLVLVYARLMLASGGGGILSLDVDTALRHGASFHPLIAAGQVWRFATCIFIHFGLWHIGFNLFALTVVGPRVEETYGRWQMVFLFMLTGIVSSIGSDLARNGWGVSAGASGAIMGLVGVAAGWGQRAGTPAGRALRNDMLKWTVYVLAFGFLIGADNWAHGFGFVAGFAWGFFVAPESLHKKALRPLRALMAVVGVGLLLGSVALALFPPASAVPRHGRIGATSSVATAPLVVSRAR